MIVSICIDSANNVYLADGLNSRIFKVNSAGVLSTYAGTSSGFLFNADEIAATSAQIDPVRIRIDKFGNFFIAERRNFRVRVVDRYGIIHTAAGIGTVGFSGDGGLATSAQLYFPTDIAFDSCNNLYITEANNSRVRKVTYPHCNYLSITETNNNKSANIYPNPVYDDLNVDNVLPGSCFSISDVSGRIMQSGSFPVIKNNISVSSYPPGLYFLYIYNQNQPSVYKIIKQ